MKVRLLPSTRAKEAAANLERFIDKAQAVAAFGAVNFDEPIWKITLAKTRRPTSSGAGQDKLCFTTAKRGARSLKGRQVFKEPFAGFLKAVVRLREDAGPKHLADHYFVLLAGRYLHNEIETIG